MVLSLKDSYKYTTHRHTRWLHVHMQQVHHPALSIQLMSAPRVSSHESPLWATSLESKSHTQARHQSDPSPPPANQHRPAAQPASSSNGAPHYRTRCSTHSHSLSLMQYAVCDKNPASEGCYLARHDSLSAEEGVPPSLEGGWPYLEPSPRRREAAAVHTRTRCHAADELESRASSPPQAGATAEWYGCVAAPCVVRSRERYVECTHEAPTLRPARDP